MTVPFGGFLVQAGFITADQLDAGLRHQKQTRRVRLGDILVRRGAVAAAVLDRLLAGRKDASDRRPIGELLLAEGAVTGAELEAALTEQLQRRQRKIGEILVELEFLTEEQLAEALRSRPERSA